MARTFALLGEEAVAELEQAWQDCDNERDRQRLLVLRLIAQHELSADQIAEVVGVSRATVFNYRDQFVAGGVAGLLLRRHGGGLAPLLDEKLQGELVEGLRQGRWRRACEVQGWLKQRTGKARALTTIYYWLGKVGGVLKVPRKTHAKKDAAKVEQFRATLVTQLGELAAGAEQVRLWVADEHRYGLLPVIRRCWSLRGVRVQVPYATRYQWGYLYEALEIDGDNRSEFLFVPAVDKDISGLFLRQIAASDPKARHIVIWDQAGFHPRPDEPGLPENVRLLPLPPYSPELNPVERIGDLIKDRVCNRLFTDLRDLENEILCELAPLRQAPARVAQLIGSGWLADQANASAPQ